MTTEKYDYLKGIAEWCDASTAPISVAVSYRRETKCEYCGAEIVWRFHVTDSSPEPREIVVGSECIKKFEQYMATEKRKLHDAMRFFEQYQALARKAKVFPEAKIELRNLDQEIRKLKEETQAKEKHERAEKHRAQREPMDALRKLVEAGAKEFMGQWERGFIDSVMGQYFEYLHLMSEKQLAVVRKLVETYSKMDFAKVEQIKAEKEKLRLQLIEDMELIQEAEMFTGNRRNWVRGLEHKDNFLDSVRRWVADGKPLTPKQKEAVQNTIKREEERREKARQLEVERQAKRQTEMLGMMTQVEEVAKRLGMAFPDYNSAKGTFRLVKYQNLDLEVSIMTMRLTIDYVLNLHGIKEQNLSKEERASRCLYQLRKEAVWMAGNVELPIEGFAD